MRSCEKELSAASLLYNVQGLAVWRYSVIRRPELVLIKDMKMKIYSKAWIYSLSRYNANPLVVSSATAVVHPKISWRTLQRLFHNLDLPFDVHEEPTNVQSL